MNNTINKLSLIVFIFGLSTGCSIVFEPLKQAANDANPDLVTRGEAFNRAISALQLVTATCPRFDHCGYQSWLNLYGSTCNETSENSDAWYGCADFKYVSRTELDRCITSILLIKAACDLPPNPNNSVYRCDPDLANLHFLAHAVCSKALHGGIGLPVMFIM